MSNDSLNQTDPSSQAGGKQGRGNLLWGVVLVVIGLLFLANNFIPGFRFGDYWPVILIVIGVGMLLKPRRTA